MKIKMIKTPMLIEGKEVELSPPESVPEEKPEPETAEPVEPKSPLPGTVMGKYVADLLNFLDNKRYSPLLLPGFKREDLTLQSLQSYVSYLVFDEDMSVVVRSLDRKEFFSLIEHSDPTLYSLLQETDLGRLLPAGNAKISVYKDIRFPLPILVRDFDKKGRTAADTLKSVSEKVYIIPDLEFLSRVMTDGETFRSYLNSCGESRKGEFPLFAYSSVDQANKKTNCLPEVERMFPTQALLQFVRETGKKDLAFMIEDYERIRTELNACDSERLFSRLKRYSPELTR